MKTTTRNNVITIKKTQHGGREIPEIWHKVRGMLKGRLGEDPVAYQHRARAEWERNTDTEIPAIWKKVFGMMKGKRRLDPVRVQRELRKEGERRLRLQATLGRKSHAARH